MTKKGHFSGKRRMPTLPTATKEQKVQKIRNAEYYDFQGVQDTLYTQSKENKVFRKLMTIIVKRSVKMSQWDSKESGLDLNSCIYCRFLLVD